LEGDIAAKLLSAVLAHPRVKRLLSTDHFSVDGTLIEAWASMKSFRPKDGSDEPPADGGGRNGETDFHGEKRSNDTRHAGYAVSQSIRKPIEEAFGWIKMVAGQEPKPTSAAAPPTWAAGDGAVICQAVAERAHFVAFDGTVLQGAYLLQDLQTIRPRLVPHRGRSFSVIREAKPIWRIKRVWYSNSAPH
jgi:hypothetical protein